MDRNARLSSIVSLINQNLRNETMFTAIINQPGYLPDTEPEYFDTCREAWQYLISELEYDWDNAENGDSETDYSQAHAEIHSLDQNLPGIVYAGNYAYSVEYTGTN